MTSIPFYRRTLDSFADDIITRQFLKRDGNWHAVLDCGFREWASDPDFASYGYGATRKQSAERCAARIRDDARGIGKFAPHELLLPGHDLHYRLMRHWAKKERLLELGIDPNGAIVDARSETSWGEWKLRGEWLEVERSCQAIDFEATLSLAEMEHAVRDGGVDPETARATTFEVWEKGFLDFRWGASMTDATRDRFGELADARLAEIAENSPSSRP